jgi:ketosteroid isomerase-like protein
MRKLTMLLFIALAVGCSGAPEPDLEGLRAMRNEWQTAFDARDAAGIAAVYASNAAVHPPNGKTVNGRTSIQKFWEAFQADGFGGQINDVEVYASGDVGYKVGTYMLTDAGGAPFDVGKYLEIWRFSDGKWQMQHDIFNSDMPLPEPPPPAAPQEDDEAEVVDDI